MHAYTHVNVYTHMCLTCSECVRRCVRWFQKKTFVTYTPAHALVPKTPVPKCTQHSLQKKCTYIYTHTHAHAYICTRTHTCIHDTAQHAEALILRLTTYAQIRMHIQIHMYMHAYKYIQMHMHIHTYMHVCTHTHVHTYTHTDTTCTYTRMQARLERRRRSDCTRS